MSGRISGVLVKYSARGIPSYQVEAWHDQLKKHRLIKGDSETIILRKADMQVSAWNEQWKKAKLKQQNQSARDTLKQRTEDKKNEALEATLNAQAELDALQKILSHTLSVDDKIDWDLLKDRAPYAEARPPAPKLPVPPSQPELPQEPTIGDGKYQPTFGFLERIFAARRERLIADAKARHSTDHHQWKNLCNRLNTEHRNAVVAHEREINRLTNEHQEKISQWEKRKAEHQTKQNLQNTEVVAQEANYLTGSPDALLSYCDMVLAQSQYPDYFPQEYDLQYDSCNRTLLIDYKLPAPEDLPQIKSIKYIASRNALEKQFIPESQHNKNYDGVVYQICLRTIHEIFEADVVDRIDAVLFNGVVTSTDRTTGLPVTACIISIRTEKSQFNQINLHSVDPKACFKALKGVGSARLSGLSAVPPIMKLDREDSRFVESYGVADSLDESMNIAAMSWEDFEHLIRELFEKEFSSNGGEVKVTQASRDGGVDAIAFDPDPIRGGKIVIQAKRYTNTVGVAAVRDLYGTVLNEGATKGILVTTSDYGSDSYAFANGKPLTLLSGANLLHLLERHGHKAKIDLAEAKRIRDTL